MPTNWSAQRRNTGLRSFVGDIGSPEDREKLALFVAKNLAALTVVINNAGIQRRVSLAEDDAPWAERQREIEILLSGPIHLNHLLVPILLRHGRPSLIANVTSGGGYLPQPFAPVYSACKAALHSYTMNLRYALSGTAINVVEIIPPAVRTALAGGSTHGADVDEFCDAIFAALKAGTADELTFGATANAKVQQRLTLDHELFDAFAGRFPVATYGDDYRPGRPSK